MNHAPQQILETVDSARVVADQLRARLSVARDVLDLGDLAHIQTTVKKIDELLSEAGEYEGILRDRLEQTAARVAKLSGQEAAPVQQS